MKNKLFITISAMAIAMLLFTGCAKMPQAEIDNANTAIEAARAAGADIYVPEAFTALTDSMGLVLESINTQNSKMFKNFKKETEKLLAITEQAGQVQTSTVEKINQLKLEIEQVITAVTNNIEASKNLVAQAPKGKEGNTALMAIKADIAAIETSLEEVKTVVGTENYITTLDKAKAVDTQINNIKAELETVIEKFNSKGRK